MLGSGGAGELAIVRCGNEGLDGEADGWSYAMVIETKRKRKPSSERQETRREAAIKAFRFVSFPLRVYASVKRVNLDPQ